MRALAIFAFLLVCCSGPSVAQPIAPDALPGTFTVLCYHEARDDVRDYPDPFAVDTSALIRQFGWLRGNGYTAVSLDQILEARRGGKPLPAKAVLLTFDDGYLSFYTRVYPLLREFGFPAVLGIVGKWIDNPRGAVVYGEKDSVTEAQFPTWDQLREMAASGLVEIASHTYDLHRGVLANPQANVQPAATTRIYDAAARSYESDQSWRSRVSADLANSASVIEREIGRRPRAVVWPYGAYNAELVRIARESGMSIALTLDDGPNTPEVPLTAVRRILVQHNPTLAEFVAEVRGPLYSEPLRVLQVDLGDVHSADPLQQELNLSTLLDRILILKPSHIYLQATADTDGDGIVDSAYFPNRHLALRADLFNRVAWQLASRVDVKVFAVMPVAGLRLPPARVAEVYEDLARHAAFDGLVFDDKTPPASFEESGTVEFTQQLASKARAFRSPLKTVRTMSIEAPAATTPAVTVTRSNAQRFGRFVSAYDYVSFTPASRASAASDAEWTTSIAARLGREPRDPEIQTKLVLMLQNPRPLTKESDAPNLLARDMRALQLGGMLNFGYYFDDFLHDNPPLAQISRVMSLRVYPLARPNRER